MDDSIELSDRFRYWEMVEQVGTPNSVKGRLRSRVEYWEEVVAAPSPIVSIIRQGYILPFVSVPEGRYFTNQESALDQAAFVTQAVGELVENGCVKEVESPPVVCSPLLVVTGRSGKKWLVINLRYVNKYLWKDKFKYEDIRSALLLFERGEYMCTFDFKSGYHHIDIHECSQTYLGFSWLGKYYVFTVLPFGLSTVCYVFTKLLRPLVRLWRSNGIKVIMYIDNGIIIAPTLEKAMHSGQYIRASLEAAGLVCNEAKSLWEPAHSAQWLGFDIDLEKKRQISSKRC